MMSAREVLGGNDTIKYKLMWKKLKNRFSVCSFDLRRLWHRQLQLQLHEEFLNYSKCQVILSWNPSSRAEELDSCWPGGASKAGNVPRNDPAVMVPSRRRKSESDFELKRIRWSLLFFCAVTQEDQDKEDEENEEKAMQNLVQTWLERLQLISVIVSKAMFHRALQKKI